MTLDRILSSAPVNKTAARVIGRGVHWEPDRKPHPGFQHWKAPPPMVSPAKYPEDPGFVDLRGKRIGRLVVVGYLGKPNKSKSARWLLRCDCGDYEARSARAVKAGEGDHMCIECHHLDYIKRNEGKA